MKTVTDTLKETEKMFIELEQRQMAFEEHLRNQDWDFHMQIVRMLVGHHPILVPLTKVSIVCINTVTHPNHKGIMNPVNISEAYMHGWNVNSMIAHD